MKQAFVIKPHLRAQVTLRKSGEGGRKNPIYWSYRADLSFQIKKEPYYGFVFVFDTAETQPGDLAIAPGGTREMDFYIRTVASEIMPHLVIGSMFTINEGPRSIADCLVTRIYRLDD